ncbi:MAG: glycosyl hydrolase 53 family protein [bacterium]|nr:glycosyl hydrolase 53 family protein [bacterium]
MRSGHRAWDSIYFWIFTIATWADPAHQTKPAAWQSLTFAQLEDSIYSYTNSVVRKFHEAQALPDAIQIGNEIGAGLLWNSGRIGGAYETPQQWAQFTSLLKAAIAGVRDSLSPAEWPEIVLHHQAGGDAAACNWFFSQVETYDVPFDVIGVSYYPWWHGTLLDLEETITVLVANYGRRVDVVETAYPYMTGWCDDETNIIWTDTPLLPEYPATEAGQAAFVGALGALLMQTPNHGTPLLCAWEPAWIPAENFGSPWENTAWFDCSGNALDVFSQLPGLAPEGLTLVRIGNDLRLRWRDDANLYYRVYADSLANGEFPTLLGSTTAHQWLLPNEFAAHDYRYFVVRGSATP